MSMIHNKTVYSTVEFHSWATRKGLIATEKVLLETYLQKKAKTLEAGTGGGRILLEMKALGFTALYGFDFVPKLIEHAKKRDTTHEIFFEIQDATCLSYADSFFDQVVYLQQIICFIEDPALRLTALREAYRVLRKGGTALFSFLSFEARSRSAKYFSFLLYLSLLRKLSGTNRSVQHLPWLKLGGKLNCGSFLDRGPYTYWYRLKEVERSLVAAGFQTVAIGSTRQISEGRMCASYEELAREPIDGMIYAVCTK